MMCKFLTYSLTLLTIVAGLFVVSACQKDDVGKSEVMMTFNTRAIVSDKVSSDADVLERMNDLRVIMVRQDGTVVDNHLAQGINASSVKFTFSTPVKTGGEYFTFLAVANENSIDIADDNSIDWLEQANGKLFANSVNEYQAQIIGKGEAYDISKGAIPQTKIWTIYVPQQDKYTVPDPLQLEYVASKISVKFVNQTNEQQSLSDIKITGITPNGKGRLFSDYIKQGLVDVYEEVYVTNDVILSDGIPFTAVNNLSAGATSDVQNYYTYPVDEANISSPMLYATWNGKEFHMPIGVTSIPRNKHIEIVVNILQGKLTVDYNVKEWKEHELNIGGAPTLTPDNGYYVEDWFADNNIEIGGGTVDAPVWNLGSGTIYGEEVANWTSTASSYANDHLRVYIPNDILEVGNIVLLYFRCVYHNGENKNEDFKIRILSDQRNNVYYEETNQDENKIYKWDTTGSEMYIRYLTVTEELYDYLHKPDYMDPAPTDGTVIDDYKVLILQANEIENNKTVGIKIELLNMIKPSN